MLLLLTVLPETPLTASTPGVTAALVPTLAELVSVFDPVPSNWIALMPWTTPLVCTITFTVPLVPPICRPGAMNDPALDPVLRMLIPVAPSPTVTVVLPVPAPKSWSAPTPAPLPVMLPIPATYSGRYHLSSRPHQRCS